MKLAFLSKLKNKHFLALVGNAIISVFSVATIWVLYRALEKTDVGIWFYFLTVTGLADALRNGLLTTATIKFYAGTDADRAKNVLGSVWYLAIMLTAILIGINAISLFWLQQVQATDAIIVIKWFGITILSSLPFNVTFWILVADEDYFKILWLRFINSGSMIVLIATMAIMKESSLERLLWINLGTNILTSFICIVGGHARLNTFFYKSKDTIKELFHFGKYSLATNISSNLLSSLNTFVINFTLGPSAVAIYNIPNRLMEIIEIPLRSFIGTGMSAMATAYNNNDMQQVTHITKKYAGMLTYVFIPVAIGTFFLADFAVSLLGGGKYVDTEAPNILRMFMFFAILYPIDRFNGVTLDIIHQPKINFYKVLVMLAANMSVAFLGFYFFKNLYGVAIATPFTLLAGLLFGYFHLKKHIQYSFSGILQTGYTELTFLTAKLFKKNKATP